MDKRDFLFRYVEPPIRSQLRFDEEAFYSTTDQLTANKIARIICKIVSTDAVVTDATACIGGATLAFANVFSKVYAIELDPTRYEYLRHNMTILQIMSKVHCILGDALNICPKMRQDVVFLDPPWGGPEYKTMERVSLYLSGVKLSEVCRKISVSTKYIALKVPTNFDEATFRKEIDDYASVIVCETQLRKMHLLILEIRSNCTTQK